ncbi:molybdenum cofactor guanylyltransferase [Oceanobacillus timonensis]|uniref:molybdenum cofactor guanylyltransferase n=1 Tax=Oceanobacillus timonensis TaxID=1926285 RepID=UPI0009BC587F|nr:molybdenum cofactor guanylyltransferase [Oceanobacillus timonensis]
METIAGILLAGGQSRRFGSPKAFLQRDGKYFYQYSIDSVRTFTDSIVLVTNEELEAFFHDEEENVAILTDQTHVKGLGPLAGMYTGMEYVSADWYLTAPIDVPFMDTSVFQTLLTYKKEGIDAIVPIVSGKIQPLLSIYHGSVKKVIFDQLQQTELSAHQLLGHLNVVYVPMEEERFFYNINRQADYHRWIVD